MRYLNSELVGQRGWLAGLFLPDIYIAQDIGEFLEQKDDLEVTPFLRSLPQMTYCGKAVVIVPDAQGCVVTRQDVDGWHGRDALEAHLTDTSGARLDCAMNGALSYHEGPLQGPDALLTYGFEVASLVGEGDFLSGGDVDVLAVTACLGQVDMAVKVWMSTDPSVRLFID
ncbi:hypothetical protein COY28_01420 [Candidatus Woesearchaeota archaeon CG_4_10_14_0_2_um_filter_57_5]|nr:MAG: hypothetical protein COV94_00570 [Candidatus Woesearchaeota archaeon CG11_big_fil_rev_8_21_14_0_20_57_5]PIZ55889.1 MAG: hypothetical protein COY28_01420 [Candidatus Woesearchaeota archaeon CG_4_10_14_0_2_um_filter_57_5]